MRSFTVVVLLAVAVSLASFAPVASAGANVTLYADMMCSQPMGDGPLVIPMKSSPSCVDLSDPTSAASAIFMCSLASGMTNMSFSAWTAVKDCSGGAADLTIASVGKTGTCSYVSINFGGTVLPAFGTVACDSSVAEVEAAGGTVVADAVRAVRRVAGGKKLREGSRRTRAVFRKQVPQ